MALARPLLQLSRAIAQRAHAPRFSSSISLSHLHSRLAAHYSLNQPPEQAADYSEQAHQELRWLEDKARAKEGQGGASWQTLLERMVDEMVEQDKPLAYILGTQPFHPLPIELLVRPPTLIPRPETEHWVSLLSQRLLASSSLSSTTPEAEAKPFRLLDIGTGTGAIGLGLTYALSKARRGRQVVHGVAVDRSSPAVELASENAQRCGLLRAPSSPSCPLSATASSLSILQADLFSPSFASTALSALPSFPSYIPSPPSSDPPNPPRFDLVVSNPPYIPLHEYLTLHRSVREWEDRGALVGELDGGSGTEEVDPAWLKEDDGLIFYRRIVALLPSLLSPSTSTGSEAGQPQVAFEVGHGQARAVERLLCEKGWETEVLVDPWGVERAVFGYAQR